MLNTPLKPMLLQPSEIISTDSNYIHQLKFDGHRALFHYDHGKITIYTRHGNDVTVKYIELLNINLPVRTCILDGEMIVLDKNSEIPKPNFESLMTRFQASQRDKIDSLAKSIPVHFVAFDILFLNGVSTIHDPLEKRLDILSSIIDNDHLISAATSFNDGQTLFNKVKKLGLEGIVSKNLSSKYKLDSRTFAFQKIKNYQFLIGNIYGYKKHSFGWLIKEGNQSRGIVEFVPKKEREAFYKISKQLIIGEDKNFVYLDPLLKGEIKYQCLTSKGFMRSASFQKFII
ncbi:DNA polymerase LigD [Niallia sp. MER TA 168]|nr:DNA polymerase LigD [Niallia sp. MER TA 168]